MRTQTDVRARRACAAVAALGLTYTAAINLPLTAGAGDPAAQAATGLPAQIVGPALVAYGHRVAVAGRVSDGARGMPVALEYQATADKPWSTIATATSGSGGAFAISAPVTRSGALRVAESQAAAARVAGSAATASDGAASTALPLEVRAGLDVRKRSLDVLSGHNASVAGSVNPATAGRAVLLQVREQGGWVTVARTRTAAQGRYVLRYAPRATGTRAARVRFGGDAANAPAIRGVGRLNSYRLAGASWYGPGGTTACGGSLDAGTMGVASKTLPCGTMVSLRYCGHDVRVPVIDRGPYVAGREFDLTVATKAALGFGDTGQLWTTS